MNNGNHQSFLRSLGEEIKTDFVQKRSILTFEQWFDEFQKDPGRHVRSVAQYVKDMLDHFGTHVVDTPRGPMRAFKLFRLPFQENGGLVGHEDVQNELYRLVSNFIRERRVSRLVLLHGPNGSAKSSFIKCLMRGLERYSLTDQGALYRFNWVFPTEKISRASIGFGAEGDELSQRALDSYAMLSELELDAKLIEELKDNPIFLIPRDARAKLLADLLGEESLEGNNGSRSDPDKADNGKADNSGADGGNGRLDQSPRSRQGAEDSSFVVADYILDGGLSHKSRLVFDALLNSYHGDYFEVLKHVQVERFYISRRYRQSAVTIEPQLRVDAASKQITVDRSLNALPTSLQDQSLFEPSGDLVDGNRGIVEYSDLLKRHPDLNKYLLATVEKGQVPVEHAILFIDAFMVGSANEEFLEAFKAQPEYASWKGRLDLVRMPYLLDYMVERRIYDQMLEHTALDKDVSPHTTGVAALWAVLTRLARPSADNFPSQIQDVMSSLTPLQKAQLYARNRVPDGLNPEQLRELRANIDLIYEEASDPLHYEGRHGVSPREMKNILLRSAQDDDFPCLSPLSVFVALKQVVKDPSIYPFLRVKPDGQYHNHEAFIEVVEERYLDLLDAEIRDAMGLVESGSYEEYILRYVSTVSFLLKGEKVRNPVTGAYEEPNEEFMSEVERSLGVEGEADEFRRDVISAVAAYRIDNPDEDLSYRTIFPELFMALEESFFAERKDQVRRIHENLLAYIQDPDSLSGAELEQVETTLERMHDEYGYCDECAQEAIAFLLSSRYQD